MFFTADTSTPPEAVWIFDAALCLWALEVGEGDGVPVSWVPSAALEGWIETGAGTLSLPGDGGVLQAAADRLGALSWGIAARYRRVLLELQGRRGSG